MKVLVTGGAGYIGSHACKALALAGHQPIVYDNLCNGHREAVKWGPLHQGDLNDPRELAAAFATHEPDAVMHFAAFAYVGESMTRPEAYYANNVGGMLCLLEAMRSAEVWRIVFSSSCATYGACQAPLIDENTRQAPISPYGRTKLIGEQMLADYASAHRLGGIALRYFNAAGADATAELGESHDPETHLIPLVLQAALGLRASITINGDDFETPDGTCIRDYLHVEDIATAHVLALARLEPAEFDAYNLGVGRGISVRQIVETVQRVTERPVVAKIGPRRPGDPARLVADPSKAMSQLGWIPTASDIEDIIRSAWKWTTRTV